MELLPQGQKGIAWKNRAWGEHKEGIITVAAPEVSL